MEQIRTLMLNQAAAALRNIYGARLAKIMLYGSYARNEQTPDSDIDLLVVLKDSQVDSGAEIRAINKFLYPLGLQYDVSISAHPISKERLETGKSFFLNRVRKEGIEI